jgi:branched-chain amino acid transport system substrate-binding protein
MPSRDDIAVGVIFSKSGAYADIGRSALEGTLAAIDEVNRAGRHPFLLRAAVRDPEGDSTRYAIAARELIRDEGCRHIIGTITSSSRKEVLPVIERADALLWYAFPYEGYEASDHVLYLGATANQHIVPLFDYVLPRLGAAPFLVGSNYIWGWEINRIARELVAAAGGEPSGEAYLPLGETDVGALIAGIVEERPDFVLSNLVGSSGHAFIRAYAELGRRDPAFAPERRPVVSCNLTEIDIDVVGRDATGVITTALFLDGTLEADAVLPDFTASSFRPSECFVAPYAAVTVLADCIAAAGGDDPLAVREAAMAGVFPTPFGPVGFDAQTGHAFLRPYLGRVGDSGRIEVLHRSASPLPPDPYLVRHAAALAAAPEVRPPFQLKVVR